VITSADPAYVHQLDESLHQIGRTRNDVRALALTHGHIDHTGMAAALAEFGATIYLHPADSHLAARPGRTPPSAASSSTPTTPP